MRKYDSKVDLSTWTDHAALENGGCIIDEYTSPTYQGVPSGKMRKFVWLLGIGRKRNTGLPPSTVLKHSGSDVFACWPFPGQQGQLAVQLPYPIEVQYVSIYHLPLNLSNDRSFAPRRVLFWGINDVPSRLTIGGRLDKGVISKHLRDVVNKIDVRDENLDIILVGNITYDAHSGTGKQSSPAFCRSKPGIILFRRLIVTVEDNWGGTEMTCLCGIHIHGQKHDV